jgi:plastocyanin
VRRLGILGGVVALGLVGSMGIGNTAAGPHTIRMVGRDTFIRNALIQSTFRFGPYRNVVQHGNPVVLRNNSAAPHTVTIVPRSSRPSNSGEVFSCKVCRKYPPKNNTGKPGINRVGDSRVIAPGRAVRVHVTARAGKTLYFLCSFHPWMQGKIIVH